MTTRRLGIIKDRLFFKGLLDQYGSQIQSMMKNNDKSVITPKVIIMKDFCQSKIEIDYILVK